MSRIKRGLQFVAGDRGGGRRGGGIGEQAGEGLSPQTVIKTPKCPCGRVVMWMLCKQRDASQLSHPWQQEVVSRAVWPLLPLPRLPRLPRYPLNLVLSSFFSSRTPRWDVGRRSSWEVRTQSSVWNLSRVLIVRRRPLTADRWPRR